jgi:hypothetical protein
MANYGGKPPLSMECPECGSYGAHQVVKTLRGTFIPNEAAREILKRATGRDISFRKRLKRCAGCDIEFESIEIARDYFMEIVAHTVRVTGELTKLKVEKNLLETGNSALQRAMRDIRRLASGKRRK